MSSERSPHHIAHLVCDVLKPCLHGFRARDHLRQLGADDRLRAQRLPKRLALRDPFQTFLDYHTLRSSGCANHDPTLVIEVAQDDEDPATLRTESVFDWHADVVESDIGCARSRRVGRLDELGRDAFLTGDEDDCQAILIRALSS